jgi:glycosyltransferase involved in cell wall biosynthesis
MHICFITSEFPKQGFAHGGVGTFIATIGKALVSQGVKVSVIGLNYTNNNENETVDGISVYRVKAFKLKGLQWFFNSLAIANTIKNVHAKHPINFVETTELGMAFLPKIKGIKYVIRMHGGHHFFAKAENRPTEPWKVFQEKRSFNKADEIIAVSKFVATETQNLLQLTNRKVTVIYNPIDTSKFYLSDASKIEKHTIFFAGSIIEKKGIRQLIQSLRYLLNDFPNVHLYIAGRDANLPGTLIPYRPILEKEIDGKLAQHITFLGVVPNQEIAKYIEKAHVCCYPSHMEAMPLAWLEVLAMGKLFVASQAGPGNEAVLDNKTGFLTNPFNPEEIANKIKYVFENSENLNHIALQARERTINEFDIQVIVKKNIDFYTSIL